MWYINILSFKEAEKGENSKMAAVRNAKASFPSHARQISLLRNSRANTLRSLQFLSSVIDIALML